MRAAAIAVRARLIAWLLGLANAHPPTLRRREFYELKDRLCRKYGQRDSSDLQHIVDRCWGYYDDGGCQGKDCRRCGGTGIWQERWVELERWVVGGHVFHRPSGPSAPGAKEWVRNVIEGRITHRETSRRASTEAQLWLTLILDRALFRRLMGGSHHCGWEWRPMLVLQSAVVKLRIALSTVNRRCPCGRRIIRPFENGYWMYCRRCAPPIHQRATTLSSATEVDDDLLPF